MNVEEYNKKHSSDYALAGLGKRTLAFFLDLLIVVVVAWVLNANVTSTFMFNALGATGVFPPLLAIIAPPLIIIAASGVVITSFDTI